MCAINYTYVGPALLVVPLFLISLINLFVAGPPLKTIVLDASGSTYGASLPFMRLEVAGSTAKFSLTPKDEMTHFFVVTCYTAASAAAPLMLDAAVTGGLKDASGAQPITQALVHGHSPPVPPPALSPAAAARQKHTALQLLQPLLGFNQYEVLIKSMPSANSPPGAAAPNLPAIEYRLTYVPSKFSYTQIAVRAFFLLTSTSMLIAYGAAIAGKGRREPGQLWVTVLLVLLIALNDPLYIARVFVGGHHLMYVGSVIGQILFSGGLFLFWLVYADGMSSAAAERSVCGFYVPKVLTVGTYVGVSLIMFVLHGRVPDRINMSDAHGAGDDPTQLALIVALCASVVCIGLWLSALVSQAVYRLGWKKVEYIYTEREKSFVGITIVFVILSLCGHLYRAIHGRRGSWMQLQLPFLTLTNSYLLLLTHAFWPSEHGAVAPEEGGGHNHEYDDDDDGRRGSLLEQDDED